MSPQVTLEGVADRRGPVHIAVDNIQIMDGLAAEECTGAYRRRAPLFPAATL